MAKYLIGLMSGTSMDAVDAALVRFTDAPIPDLTLRHSLPVPISLREELLAVAQPGSNEIDHMMRLDADVARLFARAAGELLAQAGLKPSQIQAIGSHGQTIRHVPDGPEPYTVQIGNPSLIAELTGITTVADFRRRDMAAGGQGAPLAPAFHAAFFRTHAEERIVLNIGGIANITRLSADPDIPVSGFDTGPGNILLDAWSRQHLGMPLDENGAWAVSGCPLPELLAAGLDDPYFRLPPPKSTGREYFNPDWLNAKLAALPDAHPRDVQATLLELTAVSIANAIRHYAAMTQRMLICGGGVHNRALMDRLRARLAGIPVESTAVHGIDPDFLEAMGFAWLAKRTLDGVPGNLPEVTGARGLRILGGIYPA
ncbi:MAG: anhydro-N-acetylmuramic acid kinase [Candidatus Competibacteraceae bacterium]|nr:anhydro-N-acetylmuramic acid kinase [Candidatus Competibacteraceae bacterium]MBK8750782.1 anhydro-N-acetylmuramic acid kinase [Candidatus Competibacteraceae bacterium]